MGHRGLRHLHLYAGFTILCMHLQINQDKLYLIQITGMLQCRYFEFAKNTQRF